MEILSWLTEFLLLDFEMIFPMSDIWGPGVVECVIYSGVDIFKDVNRGYWYFWYVVSFFIESM